MKIFISCFLLIASGLVFRVIPQTTWVPLKNMPTARSQAGACLLDGKVYVIGGGRGLEDPASWYASTEVYDIELDKWTVLANMQVKRFGATFHVLNNKIYAFGGVDENTVEEYDPEEDAWTLKSNMPEMRWNHTSCVYNNKVYFFGGGECCTGLKDYVYDPAIDKWQIISGNNKGRIYASCCVYGNRIYVIGGMGEWFYPLQTVDAYDPESDTWEELAEIPEASWGHIILLFKNRILLFGGIGNSQEPPFDEMFSLKKIFEYDPEKNTWKRLVDMPFARSFMTGVTYGNYIYLFGGSEGPTMDYVSAEVWRFDPEHVYIPDTDFLLQLIKVGVDINADGLIAYDEAEAITNLDLTGCEAYDLTGIEAFINVDTLELGLTPNLETLNISQNTKLRYLNIDNWTHEGSALTSLIVGYNSKLEYLCCRGNNLSVLELSDCSNLKYLNVSHNKLTSLGLPDYSSLEYLNCGWNLLTTLDITRSPLLKKLICSNTQLTNLNVFFNEFIQDLDISYLPDLNTVYITDIVLNNANIDTRGSPDIFFTNEYKAAIVNIPDTVFLHMAIREGVDKNGDSLISYGEAESVSKLNLGTNPYSWSLITNMTGIEAFTEIDTLICANHHLLESLNLERNTKLKYLDVSNWHMEPSQFTSLIVTNNEELEYINCKWNNLKELDLSGCKKLKYLDASANVLSDLDISENSELKELNCSGNQLTSLDVSKNVNLQYFGCGSNHLNYIDLSNNVNLEALSVSHNFLTSLDVSKNTTLKWLSCQNTQVTSLDVSKNLSLEYFDCYNNKLTNLDLTKNVALRSLYCGENQLTCLNLCANDSLVTLNISEMPTLDTVYVRETLPIGDIITDNSPNVKFITCSTTGINANSQSALSMYPNPFHDLLIVELRSPELHTIEITSLNGYLLYTRNTDGPTHQIDLSSFQKGIYFITVRSRDQVWTEKIIKL